MTHFLKDYNNIFFVGIGGVSMSGLAVLLKTFNKTVSGSDLTKSHVTKNLREKGIRVFYKHKASNIKNCDLVVFSGAIPKENPEVKEAIKTNIDIMERSVLLSLIASEYKNVIAISGTHGKTTTTAMIAYIFMICGLNPTVHLGGDFECIGGNILVGDKTFFITEACEFRDSFLKLKPTVSVINNIETEHLDFFKTFENEKKSFNKFAKNTKTKCFINGKFKNLVESDNLASFGLSKQNTLYAKNIKKCEDNKYSFDCFKGNSYIGYFKLNIYGKHNIENALAAISVCLEFDIDYNAIYLGLKNFNNVKRRFEVVGTYKKACIIHDYAHHPTEIIKSIKTAKEVFKKKIICVFQPHTYSRTKTLIDSFVKSFDGLDLLYILKTYSARERFEYLGSADYLRDKILKASPTFAVKGVYTKHKFLKEFKKEDFCGSVVLFLGAGDIEDLSKKICR
ncbi:MAG: UDP-N-acetylmuramate--L-alanine ligase [Clostridia bacterium]|nr:UDP-N-acetylmuramate--L-alanine ligase [Clostridia bacterium]